MPHFEVLSGYLDVKISSKSKRGLTPWKAWQRQWCEIRRLDTIEFGVELKLKSNQDGTILSCVTLSRSSTICRTDSTTKQYAFGVFNLGRKKKPILFLSGSSETDSQNWMAAIRKMLSVASYIPVGDTKFRVSIVDNCHSRSAGLIGLYGVLSVDRQHLTINDPCTGDPKISWNWYQFHQYHLQASTQSIDDKKIVVMHTSGEFLSGPGQLLMFCEEGAELLDHLVARGQLKKHKQNNFGSCKRLSRSEGDLCCALNNAPDSPVCFRSQTGSDDSGVRVSIASDDSEYSVKNTSSLMSIGLVTKTPGESETEDSAQDLSDIQRSMPRNESGVSLASGIYEEIPDDDGKSSPLSKYLNHIYENPLELILEQKMTPPPLPPRKIESHFKNNGKKTLLTGFKQRCNTLPAKDLSKLSQIFTAESEYEVMSPSKSVEKNQEAQLNESFYLPMSPVVNNLKTKLENCYLTLGVKQ